MSLELVEGEIRKKFGGVAGSNGGAVHIEASKELLYPYTLVQVGVDENGEPILQKVIDVDARTELPNPSGTTVLEHYANYLDKMFGKGRGNGMRLVNQRFKVNQISKDRSGRKEYTQIATGAAISQTELTKGDLQKEVQKQ